MVEVMIKASKFITKSLYFEREKKDQVLLAPPTYNKKLVAEGYDYILTGKLDVREQDLVFYQKAEGDPVYLRELQVEMKNFRATFIDLEFRSHEDKRIQNALLKALAEKRKAGN